MKRTRKIFVNYLFFTKFKTISGSNNYVNDTLIHSPNQNFKKILGALHKIGYR